MALTRRAFVRTIGVGGAGLLSGSVLGARGTEAWVGSDDQASAPTLLVRLDSNENPLGPGRGTIGAIKTAIGDASRSPLPRDWRWT